jgi:site-specific recombinase XerD
VDTQDVQQWTVQLLSRYSGAYASIQFRALRQFFKWRAGEVESPTRWPGSGPPKVTVTAVPVFTSVELSELNKACHGRSFAARRDAAIIAVFTATGIRLSELAGIRYHPGDPARSDLNLHAREIRIHGKGGTARTVKIGHQAARSLDRYLRARTRHAQAHRPQLWLGAGNRGPLTATGIYQIVARRGRQRGVTVYPHRFRHHFSHTWQMGRIAFDASFGTSREHALPAPQRAALRCPGLPGAPRGHDDLGLHGPPRTDATMMRLIPLRGVHHGCACWHRDASGSSRLHRVHHRRSR